MKKIDIIRKLWSSVYDLLFYIKGNRAKTLKQIEHDLSAIEVECSRYSINEDENDID